MRIITLDDKVDQIRISESGRWIAWRIWTAPSKIGIIDVGTGKVVFDIPNKNNSEFFFRGEKLLISRTSFGSIIEYNPETSKHDVILPNSRTHVSRRLYNDGDQYYVSIILGEENIYMLTESNLFYSVSSISNIDTSVRYIYKDYMIFVLLGKFKFHRIRNPIGYVEKPNLPELFRAAPGLILRRTGVSKYVRPFGVSDMIETETERYTAMYEKSGESYIHLKNKGIFIKNPVVRRIEQMAISQAMLAFCSDQQIIVMDLEC